MSEGWTTSSSSAPGIRCPSTGEDDRADRALPVRARQHSQRLLPIAEAADVAREPSGRTPPESKPSRWVGNAPATDHPRLDQGPLRLGNGYSGRIDDHAAQLIRRSIRR